MHRLHGGYAQYFNRRHGFVGHLFQDRYEPGHDRERSAALDDRGVHRAQPGRRPASAERRSDWQWSSHADDRRRPGPGVARQPPACASYFGASGGDGITRYAELVDALSSAT